jgi:prepilin-type N-terminal cleavage/methylation domain-containing protein
MDLFMTNKKRAYTAFTLIELLVTITIIGILASVAAPMYSSYMLQSKISSMYESIATAKFIVANDYYNKGDFSTANYTYDSGTGTPQFLKPTNYATSISIANGVITVTGNSAKLNGNSIILSLTPDTDSQQQVNWACNVMVPEGSSICTLFPSGCVCIEEHHSG